MPRIDQAKIAILATDGFEKSELFAPKRRLAEAGATVVVISPKTGTIKSWDEDDWGESVAVDRALDGVSADEFDALVLPGGQINPDVLRLERAAVDLIRDFDESGKTLAAICHAPWLLVEAGVVNQRKVTSYPSIKTDVMNAGGRWEDSEVVVDGALITSRNPNDLPAFCNTIIAMVENGHQLPKAA